MSLLALLCIQSAALLAEPRLPTSLQSGDLIFRDGDEAISNVVRTFDDSGFSHVGMLDIDEGGVYVIHATPQEHSEGIAGVNRDSLSFFASRARNQRLAYFRVTADSTARSSAVEHARSRLGDSFSVLSEEGAYCTELVVEAWRHAGVRILNSSALLSLPLIDRKLITPRNIIGAEAVVPVPVEHSATDSRMPTDHIAGYNHLCPS